MATHNILDKNMPVYHRFVDNQVLTNDQLNNVIDHINYQDKQTRASLIGVGNVCGVEISKNGDLISVSGGVAVTSDGDLIKIEGKEFTGYKKFNDERVKYDHFIDNGSVLDLYELKVDSSPSNVKPLSVFDSDTSITDSDKVFILYLECYPKEEEDCSPLECNAQGEEVVRSVKLLITSIEDAKKIAAKDSIFSDFLNATSDISADNFVPIYVKRIVLNTASGASLTSLKNAYAIDFNNLSSSISAISTITLFKAQTDAFTINVPNFFQNLTQNNTNFQYLNDFYKDIVGAYNELADRLTETYTICCPDPTAFPKHILRGGLNAQADIFKHKFYASPIHDHGNSIASLQLLYGRILEMIRHFSVSKKDEIIVTPSKDHHFAIGERALPFYYDLELSADAILMLNTWKLNNKWVLPNYYGYGYPQFFVNPLDYCLDGHDFFRVEGHVGRDVIDAVKDITDIRNQKGLAFDILPIAVGVSANEDTLDYDKYRIYFEDLQVVLQAWNEEINCIVSGSSQFLSNFSVLTQGVHLDYQFALAASESGFAPEKVEIRNLGDTRTKNYTRGTATNYEAYTGFATKQKVNNVTENIASTEGSTGWSWGGVIEVDDNKNDVQIKLQDAVSEKVKDWESIYQASSVNIPAEVLGALKDMEDNKLLDIEDFTEDNLENFIESLQIQCDTGKSAKKTLQSYVSTEINPQTQSIKLRDQSYLEQYYFVLNNIISTCCMIERFRVLYEEILKRKQLLLDDLVLKEFIKKHPSAEHKAGVGEGGTLIVLYYSKGTNTRTQTNVLNEFAAESAVVANQSKEVKQLLDGYSKIAKQAQSLRSLEQKIKGSKATVPGFTEFVNFSGQTNDALAFLDFFTNPKGETLADGTVIGDLCIPYICCSQTPATTFVFPDRETDLIISEDHVCKPLTEDAELVPITPTPADGEVKAFVNGEEIPDAIEVKDKKYFFNPNKVNEADYNATITFTVNDQNVAPTLAVYYKPEPEFSFTGPTFNTKKTKAKIRITNSSPEIDGQVFSWNFEGDEFENGVSEFDYSFDVEVGEQYEFTLILTATNLECSVDTELPLIFNVPEDEVEPDVSLTIDPNHLCLLPGNEAAQVPLLTTPEQAKVVALIDGKVIPDVIKENEGSTFFDPNELDAELYNKVINFTVDGQSVETTYTVYEQPQPAFEIVGEPVFKNSNTEMTIAILNTSKVIEGQVFKWAFNDDEIDQNDKQFPYTFTVVSGEVFNYQIQMKAFNNDCILGAETFSAEINVPKEGDVGNGNEEVNCPDITKERIQTGESRLVEFSNANQDALDNFIKIYNDNMIPLYDLINNDLKNVLAGVHDDEFRSKISAVQTQVSNGYVEIEGSGIQKEWFIRLYMETILMFFYIQACRKTPISAITKITGSWLPFINMIIEIDVDLVRKILEETPYYDLIQVLLDELNSELSTTLKNLLKDIINKLISILG